MSLSEGGSFKWRGKTGAGGPSEIIRRTARKKERNSYLVAGIAASVSTLVISGNITPNPGNF